MRTVRLVAVEDDYDSDLGLVLKGTNMNMDGMMADRDGTLVAHDLLEHVNGPSNIGTVWDELQALGALWYVRGQWGDLLTEHRNIYSVHENVAADITRMADEGCWITCQRTYRHDHDEDFDEILDHARKGIRSEWSDLKPHEVDSYLAAAKGHMRIGFRKAYRKYERRGRFWANSTFAAVRNAVKRAHPEWAGQEFILTYGGTEAYIRECYDEASY